MILCGNVIKPIRIAGAACTGALYSVCAYLPDMGVVAFLPLKIIVSFVMVGMAFGVWEWLTLIKRTLMFYLCSFVLAGVLLCGCALKGVEHFQINGAVYYNIPALTLVLSMLTALLTAYSSVIGAVKRRSMGSFYKKVNISVCGKNICLTGFVDSGNRLSEPMTGFAVSVIGIKTARKLFDKKTLNRIYSFTHTGLKVYPVFCKSALGCGVMPAFIPDMITADGKIIRSMVAISESFYDDKCDILLNADMLDFLKEDTDYDSEASYKALSESCK